MDAEKVEVVRSWLHPCTIHTVCVFLGLTGYYQKFIRSYGEIFL
jgi:uncharacterized protein (DUF427 family)